MKTAPILLLASIAALAGCASPRNSAREMAAGAPTSDSAMSAEAGFDASGERTSLDLNRQIIYSASQEVRVESVPEAEKKAEEIVQKAGGFISNQDSNQIDERFPRATLTARVPARGLQGVLDAFGGLGREVSKQKRGEDVTDQLVDIEARLRALRAEESAYIEIMKASRKVGDVISVQKELIRVRTEIERIDAQRANLKDQVAFSTITLTLAQTAIDSPKGEGNWVQESWAGATSSLGVALRNLGAMVIWLVVYLPVWGGCLGLVIGSVVWIKHRSRRRPPVAKKEM